MTQTFEVLVTRPYVFTEGYGVLCEVIWEGEDDQDERISDVEVIVVPIQQADTVIVGNVPCVPIPGSPKAYVPIENFERLEDLAEDDTHDLRSRFFETAAEAQEHAEYTRNRWAHPSPWESFVKV